MAEISVRCWQAKADPADIHPSVTYLPLLKVSTVKVLNRLF